MKPISKFQVLFSITTFTVAALTACNTSNENNIHSHINSKKHMKAHVHNHTDHSHNHIERNFEMIFKTEPSSVEAGKPASLHFRPSEAGRSEPVSLDLVHEMKIHSFIISKDLSYFAHEHPEATSEGSFVLKFTFPSAGEYYLFEDYTPTGSSHHLGRQIVKVTGKETGEVKLGEENLTWEGGQYKAILSSKQEIKANSSLELKATISKNGKPVTNLDNYLGALAHIVVLSEDGKEYVHVHPLETGKQGPEILLHTNFPKEDKYKVFMQFKHEGKVNTAGFVLNVV